MHFALSPEDYTDLTKWTPFRTELRRLECQSGRWFTGKAPLFEEHETGRSGSPASPGRCTETQGWSRRRATRTCEARGARGQLAAQPPPRPTPPRPNTPPTTPAAANSPCALQTCLDVTFDGQASRVNFFEIQVIRVLTLWSTSFLNKESRVCYLASHLEGAAADWFLALYESNAPELHMVCGFI